MHLVYQFIDVLLEILQQHFVVLFLRHAWLRLRYAGHIVLAQQEHGSVQSPQGLLVRLHLL